MNAVVIIPAYDPEENIIEIVNRVRNQGNQVIVVDDGSEDSKESIFRKLQEKAIVVRHRKNAGKGAAIKTALSFIQKNMKNCEIIGVMDADGQHHPEDMERVLMKANLQREAMVLGVRSIGKDMPVKSRFGNALTRKIFHLISGVQVSDTQTGLRAFSARWIKDFLEVEGTRYEYETNILFYCAQNGIPIVELPIRTIYHDKDNSCSHFRTLIDSFRIYKDILKFSCSSLSSFILDYILFCLLIFLFPKRAVGLLAANILARIFSGSYNYFMNCKYVFHVEKKSKTAVEYIGLAIGIIFLNNIILQVYHGVFGIPVYAAKILTEITLCIISFWTQKNIIFKIHSEKRGMMQT